MTDMESLKRDAERLADAVRLGRNVLEGYAALEREKGTTEGDAASLVLGDVAKRMHVALAAHDATKEST